jgi:type I restriction enzyme S subunit
MSDVLPAGWIEKPLEEIAEAQMGETILAKQLTRTGIPVFSAGQANEPWGYLDQPRKPHSKGTVVVSARGSIGFPKIPKAERFASTQTTIALRFSDEQLSEFVCQWLKTVDWPALTKGGAIPMLTVGDINELVVPLAPLPEQRRIVAKLETLLGKVDNSQQRLAKIPVLLKRLRQSVLAAACSGRLTADWREENTAEDSEQLVRQLAEIRQRIWKRREWAKMTAAGKEPRDGCKQRYKQPFSPFDEGDREFPETWKQITVSQVAFLDVGFAFKSSEFTDTGIKLLRGENLEPGKLRWTDTKCWPEDKLKGFEHLLIEEGEIILALDRPVISSGLKIARATKTDLPCVLVQRMMRFKMVEPKMTAWLYFNLRIPPFIRHLTAGLTGSDLPHVTGTGVAEYVFGLPPLAERQEIVRRVEALFALTDHIEARYAKAAAYVEKLTQSILAKAFRGELVPQDPNDEPASVLLERIRQLAHAKESSKRKTKRPALARV